MQARRIGLQAVGSDYLATLRIPLLRGRMLTSRDIDLSEQVAVINQTAAGLWPDGQDPIGRRIRLDELTKLPSQIFAPTNLSPFLTVVGIIATRGTMIYKAAPSPLCSSHSHYSRRRSAP